MNYYHILTTKFRFFCSFDWKVKKTFIQCGENLSFFTFFTRKDRILSIILLLLLLFLSWKWWLWWKWLAIDNNDEKIFFHRCCRCFELKKKKIWSSNKKLKAIHTLCDQQYCSTIVRSGEEGEGEGKKWFDSKSMSRFIRLSYSCVCVRVWFHTSDICLYGI